VGNSYTINFCSVYSVLQEWGFCGWVGNPPKENKVLICKGAQPWISAAQIITNIICTNVYTSDIRMSPTYFRYVAGAIIRVPTSDVYILVHVILVILAVQSKEWVCGRSLAGIVGSYPAGGMDVCLL
jgi:hypothetical protein